MQRSDTTRAVATRRDPVREVLVPALALLVALGAAVAGSVITGTGSDGVVGGVEGLSSSASGRLNQLSALLPLGYAFGAGMVSAVNPCGFTMLPAYLGLYLTENDAAAYRAPGERLGRAVLVGAAVTGGFVVLFAAIGLVIGAGTRSLVSVFPWIGLSVGVLLALAGAWMLSGRALYSAMGERLAARVGGGTRRDARGYFLFGLSYGTASLSCTLPVFLTVVGGSVTVSNLGSSTAQFVLYGLGMGSVITALTLSMAVAKTALVGRLRTVLPYMEPAGAVLLLVAGAYIVYYWLTLGRLLDRF